jgi:hypothetical protein
MSLTNNETELSFDLSASSGSLNAKGVSGDHSLKIDKGAIRVSGRSSSGSQSYR